MNPSDFKILIVDDEADLREIISELFEIFDFQVKTASSGNIAWKMLSKEHFDIVVSDIRMPDGTGPELLEKIKERDLYNPRVFFISGFYDFSLEEVFEMGADGLFTKPFDSTLLRNSVQKVLKTLPELWGPSSNFEGQAMATANFKNFNQAIEESQFKAGRGGFYLKTTSVSCDSGDVIDFDLKFENEVIDSLKGQGRVLWKRDVENKIGGPGLGVEILSLDSGCLKKYIDWLEAQKIKSYIPKG